MSLSSYDMKRIVACKVSDCQHSHVKTHVYTTHNGCNMYRPMFQPKPQVNSTETMKSTERGVGKLKKVFHFYAANCEHMDEMIFTLIIGFKSENIRTFRNHLKSLVHQLTQINTHSHESTVFYIWIIIIVLTCVVIVMLWPLYFLPSINNHRHDDSEYAFKGQQLNSKLVIGVAERRIDVFGVNSECKLKISQRFTVKS